MSRTNLNEKEDLELIHALDQTVNTALRLNISESEMVSRLLERYQLHSYNCRSVVHAGDTAKHLFDSKAGP